MYSNVKSRSTVYHIYTCPLFATHNPVEFEKLLLLQTMQRLYSGFYLSFYPRAKFSFAKLTWFTLRTAHVFEVVTDFPVLTSRCDTVSCSQNQDSHSQDQSKEQLHPPRHVRLFTRFTQFSAENKGLL